MSPVLPVSFHSFKLHIFTHTITIQRIETDLRVPRRLDLPFLVGRAQIQFPGPSGAILIRQVKIRLDERG